MVTRNIKCAGCSYEGKVEAHDTVDITNQSDIFQTLGKDPSTGFLYFRCPSCNEDIAVDPLKAIAVKQMVGQPESFIASGRSQRSNHPSEVTLSNDKQWSTIESKMCRIISFHPIASVKNGEVITTNKNSPYASIVFECSKQTNTIKGFITHKVDFKNLWAAFKERKIGKDKEVLFFWTKEHYKNIFYTLFYVFMPKLWVMVCQKDAFELHTNSNFRPELTGEARWLASQPIEEWKPDVME